MTLCTEWLLGEIVDRGIFIQFLRKNIKKLQEKIVEEKLQEILKNSPDIVLCQGEFNYYTFEMVTELKKNNIPVVAATSERIVSTVIEANGSSRSISIFRFVRFRSY